MTVHKINNINETNNDVIWNTQIFNKNKSVKYSANSRINPYRVLRWIIVRLSHSLRPLIQGVVPVRRPARTA